MTLPLVLVVSLLAAVVSGQQKPRPSWYIDKSQQTKEDCQDNWSSAPAVSTGPIYVDTLQHGGRSGESLAVCVFFPPAVARVPLDDDHPECRQPARYSNCLMRDVRIGGWRHDNGTLGDCANDCCEWNPPVSTAAKKAPQPTWYETNTNCRSPAVGDEEEGQNDGPAVTTGPTLMRGLEGERKSICVRQRDDSFRQEFGTLQFCGFQCCAFVPISKPQPPRQPQLQLQQQRQPPSRPF